MKKRMFSRFTSILQHAVDALAPQFSLQEEFVFHWKAVTAYFIDNKGEKLPVEQTSIPAHLEQMLMILQDEESSGERGMYGPCMEYLLQHKLLETLYSLGRTDYPPGMKQVVLSFFTKLLSRIKQPLLPHVNVHKAVHRLIKSCGEVKAAPTETEEIQFLCTVCAQIKSDPYLVNFFLEVPKCITASAKDIESADKLQQEFHLVRTLLTLSQSEDSRVAVKACEGLMLCASLPEPIAAHCVINKTDFCAELTARLTQTYSRLPDVINPVSLEHVEAKWGLDVITESEDQQTFLGKRQLVSFLSWLDYCDQLISIANPIIADTFASTIRANFLDKVFQPSLLQTSETGAISATAYLTRCLRTVCSPRLLTEFTHFMLGEDRKPEKLSEDCPVLRSRLIERCNHLSEELCLVTLKLFETLIQKENEHILHNLVIRNLAGRGYYDDSCRECNSNQVTIETTQGNSVDTNSVKSAGHSNVQSNTFHALKTSEQPNETQSVCDKSETADSKNIDPVGSYPVTPGKDFTGEVVPETDLTVSTDSGQVETEHDLTDSSPVEQTETSCASGADDSGQVETEHDLTDSSPVEQTETSCASGADDSGQVETEHDLTDSSPVEETETSCASGADDSGQVEPEHAFTDSSRDEETETSCANSADDSAKDSVLEDAGMEDSPGQKVNDSGIGHSSFEASASERSGYEVTRQLSGESQPSAGTLSDGELSPLPSPSHFRTEVHKIVNSFLSLLPEDLKSSYQTADCGYDMYLRDAHNQFADVLVVSKPWDYPKKACCQKGYETEVFYEGAFLRMLLDKLSRMMDQSYAVNLQITSVVSKLALVPHPNVHEFLLDPYLPLKDGVRTLYLVFQKVSNEIRSQLQKHPDMGQRLILARKQLIGMVPNMHRLEGQSQLEAIIVLEEFCKELSAVAFVKHHAAVTDKI